MKWRKRYTPMWKSKLNNGFALEDRHHHSAGNHNYMPSRTDA